METSRKRSKTAGAPVESDDAAAAATKIAELQAKLDASEKEKSLMQEKHKLEVNALKSKNDSHLREKKGLKSALQWATPLITYPASIGSTKERAVNTRVRWTRFWAASNRLFRVCGWEQ